mgnify:CR=1 FL=1
MNYYFKKDTREFQFSCDMEVGYDSTKLVKVWIEDPSKIDTLYKWTLDADDKTLIKGEESHAPEGS